MAVNIEFVTEPDETGKGRVIVDGKYYGLPANAVREIKQTRQALSELRDVVIDHNRGGADWKTPELFGRMMASLAKADTLLADKQ